MKKSEYITIRVTPKDKKILEEEAKAKEWTISFLVAKIIDKWIKEKEETAP